MTRPPGTAWSRRLGRGSRPSLQSRVRLDKRVRRAKRLVWCQLTASGQEAPGTAAAAGQEARLHRGCQSGKLRCRGCWADCRCRPGRVGGCAVMGIVIRSWGPSSPDMFGCTEWSLSPRLHVLYLEDIFSAIARDEGRIEHRLRNGLLPLSSVWPRQISCTPPKALARAIPQEAKNKQRQPSSEIECGLHQYLDQQFDQNGSP